MERETRHIGKDQPIEQAADKPESPWAAPDRRARRVPRWVWVVTGVLLGVLVLGVVVDRVTASPRLCSSCHEMGVRHESWTQSSHAGVTCVQCHQAPTAWYELPQRLYGRGRLLARDYYRHARGDHPDIVDGPVAGVPPMADEVCLQCHDVNRTATSGFRILIDHPEHAKRNGSCISCHVRTAHPVETRGTPLSLMAQCYTCHGTAEQPTASAECGVCHPSDYELLPASHAESTWKRGHGESANEDPALCEMCHEQSYCTDCHGVEIPHPEGWGRGPTGHAVTAEQNPQVCNQCHGDSPYMCTMCHHEGYDPTKGTWVQLHYMEVRKRGTAFCFDCHLPLYCVNCHVDGALGASRQ